MAAPVKAYSDPTYLGRSLNLPVFLIPKPMREIPFLTVCVSLPVPIKVYGVQLAPPTFLVPKAIVVPPPPIGRQMAVLMPTVYKERPVKVDPIEPEPGAYMRVLDPTTQQFEDSRNPTWRDRTGLPMRWMSYDGRTVRVVPKSAVNLVVGHVEKPVDIVLDSDTPDTRVPVPHHSHLPFAAASFLLAQDGKGNNPQQSQGMMAAFDTLIGVANKEPVGKDGGS